MVYNGCMGISNHNPELADHTGRAYRLVRRFTDGVLKGVVHTSTTSIRMEPGFVVKPWAYGCGYVVLSCEVMR